MPTTPEPQPDQHPQPLPGPEIPDGIRPWLGQYPDELDDFWVEVRSKHAWQLNPATDNFICTSKYFQIGKIKQRPQLVDDHVLEKIAVGYHVCLLRNPLYRRKRGASRRSDVGRITSFVLDLDLISAQEALDRLKQNGLPKPSIAVSTGHGLHAYYYLRTPMSVHHGEQLFKQFTLEWSEKARLMDVLDFSVTDPPRVLRMQSINYKDLHVDRGTRPSVDAHMAYINTRNLAHVVLDNSSKKYGLDELIPSFDHQMAREALDLDLAEIVSQDTRQKEMLVTFGQKATRQETTGKGSTKSNGLKIAVSNPSTHRLSPPCNVLTPRTHKTPPKGQKIASKRTYGKSLLLNIRSVAPIIEKSKVGGPGQRNAALATLVALLRPRYARLTEGQLHQVHALWYWRWLPQMSGRHDEASSLQEFLYTYTHLPAGRACGEPWSARVTKAVRRHPQRKIAPTGRARKLADIMWTAQDQTGCCYMSCREAGRVLGRSSTTGLKALRDLMECGLIEELRKGSRATGRASEFTLKKPRLGKSGKASPSHNPKDVTGS